jgi:maltose O-acetyltransferase
VNQRRGTSMNFARLTSLAIYYLVARFLPTQPTPGWRMSYAVRRRLVMKIFSSCGDGVIVKRNCYFGKGDSVVVGSRSQLGADSRIGPGVTIGDDCVMGPGVIVMTTSHAFEDPAIPIRLQGALPVRPVTIGDDVWIGTRVVILPGVSIGRGAVIGASSVVARDIPPLAVAVGSPARVIRFRGEKVSNLTNDPTIQE